MNVTRDEFEDFDNAYNIDLNGNGIDLGILSRKRWSLTKLSVNKYIYIADHYEELKEKFKKGSE